MTVWYVNDTTGQLLYSNPTALDPVPAGTVAVTTPPDDERMFWDLVGSFWYWTKAGLKELAATLRDNANGADYTIQSTNISGFGLPLLTWLGIYQLALKQAAGETRVIYIPGTPHKFYMTNAEFISLVEGVFARTQKYGDIYATLSAAIDANTITTQPGLESAWSSGVSGYVNPRTATIQADIKAALDLKQNLLTQQGAVADAAVDAATDGATNALTNAPNNAPTNLNVLTTLLGALTGEVNATNARQNTIADNLNDLAGKYNGLAAKYNTSSTKQNAGLVLFNSLLAKLRTRGTIAT